MFASVQDDPEDKSGKMSYQQGYSSSHTRNQTHLLEKVRCGLPIILIGLHAIQHARNDGQNDDGKGCYLDDNYDKSI